MNYIRQNTYYQIIYKDEPISTPSLKEIPHSFESQIMSAHRCLTMKPHSPNQNQNLSDKCIKTQNYNQDKIKQLQAKRKKDFSSPRQRDAEIALLKSKLEKKRLTQLVRSNMHIDTTFIIKRPKQVTLKLRSAHAVVTQMNILDLYFDKEKVQQELGRLQKQADETKSEVRFNLSLSDSDKFNTLFMRTVRTVFDLMRGEIYRVPLLLQKEDDQFPHQFNEIPEQAIELIPILQNCTENTFMYTVQKYIQNNNLNSTILNTVQILQFCDLYLQNYECPNIIQFETSNENVLNIFGAFKIDVKSGEIIGESALNNTVSLEKRIKDALEEQLQMSQEIDLSQRVLSQVMKFDLNQGEVDKNLGELDQNIDKIGEKIANSINEQDKRDADNEEAKRLLAELCASEGEVEVEKEEEEDVDIEQLMAQLQVSGEENAVQEVLKKSEDIDEKLDELDEDELLKLLNE